MSKSTSTASGMFRYEALNEKDGIRLILLQPQASYGTAHTVADPGVQCSLIHTTLSKCDNDTIDSYTALSYVWGDATDTRTIYIDRSPMQVTANLYAALCDMRNETRVLRLWADALCINQKDDEEKSWQVMLMRRIYETAQHTVIYLGPVRTSLEALLESSTSTASQSRMYGLKYAATDVAKADLLSRPWFSRIWVFQELILSRNPWVQCERLRLKWDQFYDLLNPLNDEPPPEDEASSIAESQKPNKEYNMLLKMQAARRKHQFSLISKAPRSDLLNLITSRRGLGVTDSRDMIFAHIGLASDDSDPRITADYKKSHTQVYENFTRYEVEKARNFDFLSLVGDLPLNKRMQGLASWAPDWTRELLSHPPLAGVACHYRRPDRADHARLNNSRSDHPRQSIDPDYSDENFELDHVWIQDPPVLARVSGVLDVVLSLSVELSSSLIPPTQQRQFEESLALIEDAFQSYEWRQKKTSWMVFFPQIYDTWRTVVGNSILPALQDDSLATKVFTDMFEMGRRAGFKYELVVSYLVSRFRRTPSNLLEGRRVAVMASGLLGIVPTSTCIGDVVSCRTGSDYFDRRLAWVLRPLSFRGVLPLESQIRSQFQELESRGGSNSYVSPLISIEHYAFVGQGFKQEKESVGYGWGGLESSVITAIH